MKIIKGDTHDVPIADLTLHPDNVRQGDIGAIHESIEANGWYGRVLVQQSTGRVIAGNHRLQAAIHAGADTVPAEVIDVDDDTARRIMLADNRTNDLAMNDQAALADLLEQLQRDTGTLDGTGYDPDDLDAILADLSSDALDADTEKADTANNRPSRLLAIDAFFTISGRGPRCCCAIDAGLKYGTQSSRSALTGSAICPLHDTWEAHRLDFIDNDWKKYDHAMHTEVVAKYTPKYATVVDAITKRQADEIGIKHTPLDRILDMADELSQHAANVIVIPKYDCLNDIPDRFVLGYSVPTSHGGTPIPAERFRGRRVHILGGSWKAQLQYLSILRDDVVSLDNNYILRTSEFGQYTNPDGNAANLQDALGFDVSNGMTASLVISLGAIAAQINQLLKNGGTTNE